MTESKQAGVGALGRTGAPKQEWLIYNADYGQFWGPDSGGYFGLWGAGLYTEEKARSLASNKDRRDQVHHITEYRDQIGNMRGAFERLSAALEPKDDHRVVAPQQEQEPPAKVKQAVFMYLNTLTITSDNIGDIRRSLFMPFDCKWNGWVRDMTAELENKSSAAAVDPPTADPDVDVRLLAWAVSNCHMLARRRIRAGVDLDNWEHVQRICEKAGARSKGVLRASLPTEITDGSGAAVDPPPDKEPR